MAYFGRFSFIVPIDAAQCAHQNALKTNVVAIKLMKLGQLEDAGCAGIESAKALAVTGGGYKRRLQTAVTNGSCVVSETEMKPKRNRNQHTASGLGITDSLTSSCTHRLPTHRVAHRS